MTPAALGALRNCTLLLGDSQSLSRHIADEGYLFLRGLLDREDLPAARMKSLRKICSAELLSTWGMTHCFSPNALAMLQAKLMKRLSISLKDGRCRLRLSKL
ncbi:MAG: hypothetical protein R2867_24835 [Caldilineaceae bacterium]